jgi:23S rRNA pseudouridine1911/1915/1917 synthase
VIPCRFSCTSNPCARCGIIPTGRPSTSNATKIAAIFELRLAIHRPLTVTQSQALLAYLLDVLGRGRRTIKNLLKFGAVQVNGVTVHQFDHLLLPGDQVTVGHLRAAMANRQLERARIRLVYEDDALIIVEKPSGLLTVATDGENADTLYARLNEYLRSCKSTRPAHAFVVHRLDQETSGLVLFARSDPVKRALQADWKKVEKTYFAVVQGRPNVDQGTITSYLIEDSKSLKVFASDRPIAGSRLAIAHYRVLKTRGNRALVEIRLETGRKHQIRVQLASVGCPVTGDHRYGAKSDAFPRLALHAGRLTFAHPLTGQRLDFISSLPKSLRILVS